MLQTIREHTQGWIAGTIITIIILTFALWGIHSYFVSNSNNSIIAQVNGVNITREQLSAAYERMRRQAQTQYGAGSPASVKDDSALKNRALQALIEIEVLKQASTAQGFQISDVQIDNYLQSMPEFQIDGQFSIARFQEVLSSALLSTSEFLELIKTSLLIDQPKLGIMFTSFALPSEAAYTISLVNQERDIQYITIPLQYFLAQNITVSPEKIQSYYQQHQNEFMTPEQVNVEYLELSLSDLAANMHPNDATLKSFYNENINSYSQAMSWKLTSIEIPLSSNASKDDIAVAERKAGAAAQALSQGDSIAKVAHDFSAIQNAMVQNQSWVTLNQVPADLQNAVSTLTKPGQIARPVTTSKGIVIVKAVNVREPKIQAFEEVKDKIRDAYIHQHAEEKFSEVRDQLADFTYEHPESLQYAAKSLSLPVKTSDLFAKDKPGKDISQYKKVREMAFSNDVLNLQNNSDVIQLNPETVLVLRVKSHIPSTLLPLKNISNQIADKLKVVEANVRAEQFASTIKEKLLTAVNSNAVASSYHLTWSNAGYIGRYSTKVDSAILDTAFRLPNPATVKNQISYGISRLPSGYAIVAVKSVKQGTVDNKQQVIFAEQVQNSEGLLEYQLYKQSQIYKAKIKAD